MLDLGLSLGKFLKIHGFNVSEDSSFVIWDINLDTVKKAKYTEVMLDQYIFLEEHINILQTKISRALGFLKYAKKFLLVETLSLIYNGIVEPNFRCCCSVLGSWGESRKVTLQKLQNRAAK